MNLSAEASDFLQHGSSSGCCIFSRLPSTSHRTPAFPFSDTRQSISSAAIYYASQAYFSSIMASSSNGRRRTRSLIYIYIYIGGLSLLLFAAGQFIECPVSGIIAVLCGNFMRSATSSFPFLCWLPAPLFGICWGKALIHCRNKDRLYGCAGILSLAGLCIILLMLGKQGMLTQAGLHELNVPSIYYSGSVKTTAAAIIIFMLCLSIFYFLSRIVQWSWAKRFIRFMSSNLTVIYFAQWIIIPRLALLLPTPDAPVSGRISVCISAAVVCLSALCALAWPKVLNRLKKTKAGKFI